MNYIYRLSRRLAQAHLAVFALIMLACTDLQSPTVPVSSGNAVDSSATSLNGNNPPISMALATNSSCANQPAGLTVFTDNPWNTKPPYTLPGGGSVGWRTFTGSHNVSILTETVAPRSPNPIIEGKFPKGAVGGSAPFTLGIKFPKKVKTVYFCVWTKLSPNFTNNGNTGTKWGFLRTPYGTGTQRVHHYFNLADRLGINLQSYGAKLNRNMLSQYSMIQNAGVWHRIELLVKANTLGMADGVAKMWVDGAPILSQTNVRYFFPNQAPAFEGISWTPTYGGGHNPVPYDMWQKVDHWMIGGI